MKKQKGHGVRAGLLIEHPRPPRRIKEMPMQPKDIPLDRSIAGDIALVRDAAGQVVAFRWVCPCGCGNRGLMALEGSGTGDLEWRWNADTDKPTLEPLVDEYRASRGYESAGDDGRADIDELLHHQLGRLHADRLADGVWE